jgi:hypothetical protein
VNAPKLFQLSDRIALTLWVGGMWVTGYLAAPLLFATIAQRSLAGEVAGELFRAMSVVGLACGAVLLLSALLREPRSWWRRWPAWIVIAMVAVTAVGQFVVQPMMAELKELGLEGQVAAQFGRMHGVASALFGINSLLGLILVAVGGLGAARD